MIIALAIIGGAAATFILLLAIVILGTQQEPEQIELRVQAPNPLAGAARRMLGVSVRRPDAITPGGITQGDTQTTTIACPTAGPDEDGDFP